MIFCDWHHMRTNLRSKALPTNPSRDKLKDRFARKPGQAPRSIHLGLGGAARTSVVTQFTRILFFHRGGEPGAQFRLLMRTSRPSRATTTLGDETSHARMRGDARPVQSARSARHLHRAVEAEDTIVDAA